MATKTLVCENITCKYHSNDNSCNKRGKIFLDYNGCKNFEANIFYYIKLVFEKMNGSNFIVDYALTNNLRFGIYAICQIYGLRFFALRGYIGFTKTDNTTPLSSIEITQEPFNEEEFNRLNEIVLQNKVDDFIKDAQSSKTSNQKTEEVEDKFGWLSPTGDFYSYGWGEHEEGAFEIIDKKYPGELSSGTAGDFLVSKNWILIDSPYMDGCINITRNHSKKITKKQREFLFDYFTERHMDERARDYLED